MPVSQGRARISKCPREARYLGGGLNRTYHSLCLYTCVYIYVHMHAHICTNNFVYAEVLLFSVHIHVCVRIYVYVCVYVCIYIYVWTIANAYGLCMATRICVHKLRLYM